MIRGAVVDLLRGRGYQVLEAGDGPEAISKADQYSGRIHALLSDVVMPIMHGPELADRLRRTRPDLHVMFLSAYAKELAEGGRSRGSVPCSSRSPSILRNSWPSCGTSFVRNGQRLAQGPRRRHVDRERPEVPVRASTVLDAFWRGHATQVG